MDTLSLSPRPPKEESRWKTLLWPTVETEVDIDTVTRQGFWLCVIVAAFTLLAAIVNPLGALIEAVFFFLCGVGVRQRSTAAAAAALLLYVVTSIVLVTQLGMVYVGGATVLRVLMSALLVANVRATWLAQKLRARATEPPPVPLDGTWSERFSDRMPAAVWPWARWIFYPLAVLLTLSALAALILGGFNT